MMTKKTEAEAVASRLSIPNTRFDLQYVRSDFIMFRVIARNLIMWSSFHPSKDWVWSQLPEIVRCGVKGVGGDDNDIDYMDVEAFMQAYVNIVVRACTLDGMLSTHIVHYPESSFCESLLPERAILKTIRVCGPHYWPHVVDFTPEDKPWWNFGDKNNPFNYGILFIKRNVGACSYVNDPIRC